MSVYRRGKSWYVNITIAGHRIHRKAGSTKKQAETIASELKTRYRLKQLSMTDIKRDTLFADIADEYLYYVQDTKSARTYELEATDYKKHLDPYFGGMIAQDIDEETLRRFQGRQKNKGLANRTINMHIGLIRKILYHGKIRKVGDIQFPMFEEPKKVHAFLPPTEYKKLIRHFTPQAMIALYKCQFGRETGMRPAELTYLQWPDVDLKMRTAKIQGKPGWKPKEDQERVLPLNLSAWQILKHLEKQRKGIWIFSNTSRPVKSHRRALETASRRAGIRRTTMNMIRHSFATHMLMDGGDIEALRQLMGHKSLLTTTRYTHSIDEHLKKSVAKLKPVQIILATKSPHRKKHQ